MIFTMNFFFKFFYCGGSDKNEKMKMQKDNENAKR